MLEEKLLRLERMSHAEKVMHWAGERPWEIDGVTLRLPFKSQKFAPAAVHMDQQGNITKMPPLVNRPCFGQPTAFLRHGGNQHIFDPRTGGKQPNRCARCPVVKACEFVGEKRLTSSEELRTLYEEWKRRGGRDSAWPKRGSRGSASVTTPHLLDALRRHSFTSISDDRVQEHYRQRIEQHRQDERERKRRERIQSSLSAARNGDLWPEVKQILNDQCLWRSDRYDEARQQPDAPLPLHKVKRETVVFDSLVWIACERIKLRGGRINASSCATTLQELGIGRDRSQNALRDKVRRSLNRIAILESLPMAGSSDDPVWPRFTAKDLLQELERRTLHDAATSSADVQPQDTLQNAISSAKLQVDDNGSRDQ